MKKFFSNKRNIIDAVHFAIIASFLFYAAWSGFYPYSFTHEHVEGQIIIYHGMLDPKIYIFDIELEAIRLTSQIDSLRSSALTFVSLLLVGVLAWIKWYRGGKEAESADRKTKWQKYKKILHVAVAVISLIVLLTLHISILNNIYEGLDVLLDG
ncbi:hypothetical protein LGQ02_04185 [Bacillus shivajii]|uniref:hypothetical protein n=1 Tax=Bacillus shivajii TaxID=1983719 RepID=UPI001CFB897C|nr:hypothetical protein [Bacillus shivajii]UCZ53990.1 hypothetical protein LGQ02_04185 [Bacillus shivajii]